MLKRLDNGEIYFGEAKWNSYGTITCVVQIDATGEVVPFTADPNDSEEYGRELFTLLSTKYSGLVAPCTQEEKDEDAAAWIKHERNQKLAETDWITNSDVQLENQAEWLAYRQALRDISDQPGYPHEVVWPVEPEMTKNIYSVS